MNVLIVSATDFEVKPFHEKCKGVKVIGKKLKRCSYKDHKIDFLVTGIGMVNTSFQLGKYLSDKYDVAINAGIGGSFKKNIPIGTVVNIVEDCFSEMGAEDGDEFLTMEDIDLGDQIVRIKKPFKNKVIKALPKHYAITVNKVHGNEQSIKQVIRKFAPEIESMEGAAFFNACNEVGLFCAQIRAVSNYVERRNKNNWNIPLAIETLNIKLQEIIDSI